MSAEILHEFGSQLFNTTIEPPVLCDQQFELEYQRHIELVAIAINSQNGSFDKSEEDRKNFIRSYPEQFEKFFGLRVFDLDIEF